MTPSRVSRQTTRSLVGLAAGVGFFINGVVLGAGFTASSTTSVLLTIAIALEYLFLDPALADPSTLPRNCRSSPYPRGLALLTVWAPPRRRP